MPWAITLGAGIIYYAGRLIVAHCTAGQHRNAPTMYHATA